MAKSPKLQTDPAICTGVKNAQKDQKQVVTAAELVCNKSFKVRFADVLTGAC
jgi:hypothetical protein